MNNKLIIPSIFFSALTLTACGGGSDGTADNAATFTLAERIDLTAINTDEAAAEVAGSTASSSIGGVARGSVPTKKTNSRIMNVVNNFKTKAMLRNKVVSNGVNQCDTSGTMEFVYDDVTSEFTITFANCSEYGELTNGRLSGSFSETNTSTIFTMSFSGFSLKSTVPGDDFNMLMDGVMTLTSTSHNGYDENVIDGSKMVIDMSYSGRSVLLGNYKITYDDYYYLSYDISDFEYDMNSETLGGSFNIQSTKSVYQRYSDDYPYAGEIKLTGANNASILITIIDASSITLEEDLDGDSVYESSNTITWSELEAYLQD